MNTRKISYGLLFLLNMKDEQKLQSQTPSLINIRMMHHIVNTGENLEKKSQASPWKTLLVQYKHTQLRKNYSYDINRHDSNKPTIMEKNVVHTMATLHW